MTGCLAKIAQLGERQTEDLHVPGSIPDFRIMNNWHLQRVATRATSQPAKIERYNVTKAWHMNELHATVDKMLKKFQAEGQLQRYRS